MIQFSNKSLKHAKLIYQIKEQLSGVLPEQVCDDIDLINIAEEITQSLKETPEKDTFRDPGVRRDYRNYDVDDAFAYHQNEIFTNECYEFDELSLRAQSVEQILASNNAGWLM